MKKRVLFISSRPIYPTVGGYRIRAAQQLEFLTQRYNVDVIYLNEKQEEDVTGQYLQAVGNVIHFHMSKYRSYWRTLYFLFNPYPLQVNYYYSKQIQQFIKSHIAEYDFVFCMNIRTAEYVRKEKGIKKYIDIVDALSMNYEKARKMAGGIKKWIYNIEYKRCIKYEQQVLKDFDSCAIISNIDKQYILRCQQNSSIL